MLATISHILFDLDGLLIDTETCYTIAFNNVTKKYGKEFPWELKTKCMGLTPDKTNELIIDELDLPISVEQLGREAEQQVSIEIPNAKLMPGAHRLVKHFYEHNIPMAIATGSDRKGFDLKISKHKDFFDKYFAHCVLAGDDPNVKRGKPFPDVFIEAMKKFGSDISPENVLVSYFHIYSLKLSKTHKSFRDSH